LQNLKTRFKAKLAFVIPPLLLIWQSTLAASAVIANPGIGVDSLTKEQVSQIFLGNITTLPNGTRIVVADHQDGDPIKDAFYSTVLGMRPTQLKAYWAKIIFTGEGLPPKALFGDKSVKEFVASTPGAIGYISAQSVDSSVKVLFQSK